MSKYRKVPRPIEINFWEREKKANYKNYGNSIYIKNDMIIYDYISKINNLSGIIQWIFEDKISK